MPKKIELKIKNPKKIYQELAKELSPYREKPVGSALFIVEGTKQNPKVAISYPGKKLKRRKLKIIRSNSVLWANLYDFEVVPYKNGKRLDSKKFTFGKLFKDFYENKIQSKKFWKALKQLYYNNTIPQKAPKLSGINSKFYLLMLRWIWLQEDFNYRFNWKDVSSPVRYTLETRTGTTTRKGAGRAKFFAALVLLKNGFSFEQVIKIIPLY